ncbi:Uncharacterised protein [uncultured archaeon]|nr:Uncharacterised protein [uncultured archaeon]
MRRKDVPREGRARRVVRLGQRGLGEHGRAGRKEIRRARGTYPGGAGPDKGVVLFPIGLGAAPLRQDTLQAPDDARLLRGREGREDEQERGQLRPPGGHPCKVRRRHVQALGHEQHHLGGVEIQLERAQGGAQRPRYFVQHVRIPRAFLPEDENRKSRTLHGGQMAHLAPAQHAQGIPQVLRGIRAQHRDTRIAALPRGRP